MAVDCVSLNPRTSRHKRHTVSYQSREVIDHFCRAAPGPTGGRLTAGKNADQSLALLLDSPDFAQGMDQWAAEQPLNQGRPELAAFAAETLRRWHEYLTQGGGYRLGHGCSPAFSPPPPSTAARKSQPYAPRRQP